MKTRLGKYALGDRIGGGSMGTVYAAYDEVLERHVALKTMRAKIGQNPELQLRFYREAKSAARLHHPNIVAVYDMGEEGETAFIAMELLDGKDLKKIIEEKTPMSLEQKLSIIAQVAEGMAHAHNNGILHRDIKPGNIHISPSGNAKILDFGIAHIPASSLTESGVRLGTPMYMSPEQIRGLKCDSRSDIFSTGIVMYELLTWTHPFRDKTLQKTLDRVLFDESPDFARHFPDAPSGLWPALSPALAKDPNRRYSSMSDLSAACRSLLRELQLAPQPARDDRAVRASLRRAEPAPIRREASAAEPLEATSAMPAAAQPAGGPVIAQSAASGEVDRLVGLGRQALGANDFAKAEKNAHQALQLDGSSTAPRDLLEKIDAQRRKLIDECVAGGMAAGKRAGSGRPHPSELPQGASRETHRSSKMRELSAVAVPPLESTVLLAQARALHPALRLGLPAVATLALLLTALVLLSRPDAPRPGGEATVAKETDGESSRRAVEVLLVESQSLRAQRKFAESETTLRRVLEIDPANAAALAIRGQLTEQRSGKGKTPRPAKTEPLLVAERVAGRHTAVEMPRAADGAGPEQPFPAPMPVDGGVGSAYFEVTQDAYEGCEILLDGSRLPGPYPARVPRLAAGAHTVLFRWNSGKYAGQELSSAISIGDSHHVVARCEPQNRTVTVQQAR